jgi:hypothetical protein
LLKNEDIPFRNLLLLIEFVLELPGTNAEVERIFTIKMFYGLMRKTNSRLKQ